MFQCTEICCACLRVEVETGFGLEITAMIPSPDPYHCPVHLETLNRMDQLFVYKKETTNEYIAEVCCGIMPGRRYYVMDGMGNKVFSIIEDSECCDRYCYGAGHYFIMDVTDHSNQKLIRLVHPSACCCASHQLEVQSPPGNVIGYIHQKSRCCQSKFTVEDERGKPAFKIERPSGGCICCRDNIFEACLLVALARVGPTEQEARAELKTITAEQMETKVPTVELMELKTTTAELTREMTTLTDQAGLQ
ncbi:phospholipid scramblase 2-like [Garra rufa]|uniref:phospholipid scramblase 2-like n=1 Tax=Garra rufa TaxID=137080 RepID=UPI003CCEF87F